MKTKAVIGAGVAIAAIILLMFAFTIPWYNYSAENVEQGEETVDIEMDFHLDEAEVKQDSQSTTYDYQEEDLDALDSTFGTTEMFVMIAVIGTILGLIGAILVAFGILNPKIGSYLAVVGIIFAFVAPLYLWVYLPGAFEEDMEWGEVGPHQGPLYFAGGGSVGQEERTWGPAIGWFLLLVAGILNVVVFRLTGACRASPSSEPVEEEEYQPMEEDEYIE